MIIIITTIIIIIIVVVVIIIIIIINNNNYYYYYYYIQGDPGKPADCQRRHATPRLVHLASYTDIGLQTAYHTLSTQAHVYAYKVSQE